MFGFRALAVSGSVAAALLVGCMGPGEPARFSGNKAAPVASPEEIREFPVRPRGYVTLGLVWSRCSAEEGLREIEAAWLKDIDCSEELLVWALREKAAAVGAEVLIGRSCGSRVETIERGRREIRRSCSARVARPTEATRAERGVEAVPGDSSAGDPVTSRPQLDDGLPYVSAAEAWRIRVTFTPSEHADRPRRSKRPDLVRQVEVMPAADLPLGDILARCEGKCARDSVHDAVRTVAARVGADDVVSVRCVQGRPGWICTGRAAVYEVDPETHPRAR